LGKDDFFLQKQIEVELSWLFGSNSELECPWSLLRTLQLQWSQSVFDDLVEQNFGVITTELITIKEKFILFFQLTALDGIGRQENLAARSNHKARITEGAKSVEKL